MNINDKNNSEFKGLTAPVLILFFTLILLLGVQTYISIYNQYTLTSIALSSLSFLLSIALVIVYIFKGKTLNALFHSSQTRADPILLLLGHGLDLYDFTEIIQTSSKDVENKINDIKDKIESLDKKIHKTSMDMDQILQIVTQLADKEVALIKDVSKTSDEIRFMFEIVNAVIDEIDSRNENMQNLVSMSQNGGEKVKRTNSLIEIISNKANELLKMVDFINNVTKETNLLAINAAIEASHSDSEGKGFAVIADEMKKLAVLTSQKAKEISKLMRGNIEDYRFAHTASQESGEAFHFITSEIHIVSGTIAEVVQTISELKSRGTAIIVKAGELDLSAEIVKNSSTEVHREIVTVNETLTELEQLSIQVKDSVKEIALVQKEIADRSQEVYEIALKINNQTDSYLGIPK